MTDTRCKTDGGKRAFSSRRLAIVSGGLALLSCYGTAVLIGLLALFGVTLVVNPRLWAAAIVVLAGLAVFGLLSRLRQHGRVGPSGAALLGFGLIVWVMLRSYDPWLEAAGFAALTTAILWDRSSPKPGSRARMFQADP